KWLNHLNMVPTLGAGSDIAELCTVSSWIPDGSLLQYLNKYPGANRVSIVIGVADGLSYLHSNDVVRGDLGGRGIPRISDLGISSVTFDPISNNAPTAWCSHSLRWAAPEISEAPLNSEHECLTEMSGVYPFGVVIFTGKLPFPDDLDPNVQLMAMKDKRPPKLADASKLGLLLAAWKLIEDCWSKK
ncbi:kinase-like protein, partial [Thelephora ganbajun]